MSSVLEYLTANQDIAFPFTAGALGLAQTQAAITLTPTPLLPRDFLVDAVFVLPQNLAAIVNLVEIIRDSETEFTLRFRDYANAAAVIDVDIDTAADDCNDRGIIRQVTGDVTATLVVGAGFLPYLVAFDAAVVGMTVTSPLQFGSGLPLEACTVEFRGLTVTTFGVRSGAVDATPVFESGDVRIKEGWNIGLTVDGNSVTISALPGIGDGKVPRDNAVNTRGCVDFEAGDQPVRMLKQVGGNRDSNVDIVGKGCYRVVNEPDNAGTPRLLLYNDCSSCCDCDDYADTANAINIRLRRLAELWQGDGVPLPTGYNNLESLVATFEAQITYYNTVIVPSLSTVLASAKIKVGNSSGPGKSSSYGIMTLSVRNRMAAEAVITGTVTLNKGATLYSQNGTGDQILTAAGSGPFTLSGTLSSGTETLLTIIYRGTELLTGVQAVIVLNWTQDAVPRSLTLNIADT